MDLFGRKRISETPPASSSLADDLAETRRQVKALAAELEDFQDEVRRRFARLYKREGIEAKDKDNGAAQGNAKTILDLVKERRA